MKRVLQGAALTILAIASMGAMWLGWRGELVTGEVPMAPAPTASSERGVSSENSAPSSQSLSVDMAPATATPEPTTPIVEPVTPEVTIEDIDSTPVHIEIRHGDSALVQAEIVPIQLTKAGEINPPSGKAGWYGPPQWDTVPGNLSEHPAVLAAHVTYSGQRDVFYRLSEARQGDTVVLTYASGDTAEFIVDNDPVSVGKDDVVVQGSDYDWVWQLDQLGRVVSIITCDPSLGRDLSGHSYNNWVVQATRIK